MFEKTMKTPVLLIIACFLLGIGQVYAQEISLTEGVVSYITGQNIYVKFASTQGIENGDTLYVMNNEIHEPVLIVQHRSSISCLCAPIGNVSLKVSDKIFSKKVKKQDAELLVIVPEALPEKDVNEQVLTSSLTENKKSKPEQDITGRLSLSSYSNFSNAPSADVTRFRYTLNMNASNIANSKLSAETYISFTHKLNEWDFVKEDLNNALKVYSLALKYDFNESASLWVGRKINPNIANISAVDGVQFQYGVKNLFFGVVAGSRPDFLDYSYNMKLFEYGAYAGHNLLTTNGFVQTTLAFFEQRNNSNTDRRFVYFQHSNSYFKNLNIFSSFELDLYRLENGIPTNTISLTSMYLSLNYRISRKISLFGSYDNRKNVIYYETFRNYSEEILNQASRQGLRFRVNYRPVNNLMLAVNAGTRFMKADTRPTKTVNGTASYSNLPGIKALISLSANLMQTGYLDGQVYGVRLSKDIIQGKISTMLNYRYVDFKYANVNSELRQNIGELDLTYQFNKSLYLSVNFESTFQEKENFNRLYLNLRCRF
jgi:hypothetical protein